jgi:hypothetical protein
MKKLFFKTSRFLAIAALLLACATAARGDSFSMQIVADNDFAVFGGTSNSITSLIYQNDYSWPDQLNNLSSFTFNLQPGETTFYILGMGGGGTENISGTINAVDISSLYTYNPETDSNVWSVSQSSNLAPYLTGYLSDSIADSSVADGTYSANISDVQAALVNLTWGDPTPTFPWIDGVAAQSPTGQGFHFDPNNAVLYRFDATDVGVETVPEPSTWLLLLVGAGAVIAVNRFRRSSQPCV